MQKIRGNKILNFFAIILAVLIFNMSIDPPDVLANLDADVELEEDLSVNEMESITEVLLEKAFDIENAVPENDDPDSDNFVKKVEVFQTVPKVNIFDRKFTEIKTGSRHSYTNLIFSNISIECFSPPPEA
jgi:hypothetical protein